MTSQICVNNNNNNKRKRQQQHRRATSTICVSLSAKLEDDDLDKDDPKSRQQNDPNNGIPNRRVDDNNSVDDDSMLLFDNHHNNNGDDDLNEEEFLQRELQRLEKLEELLAELEEFATPDGGGDDDDNDNEYDYDIDHLEDNDFVALDQNLLLQELLESFPDDDDDDAQQQDVDYSKRDDDDHVDSPSSLEAALLQGVVPADAGVGSGQLPGDYGFDPLHLSTSDYIQAGQEFVANVLLPFSSRRQPPPPQRNERPRALILRDYREAEIRHGRLAMLAAMIWPLQEMLDQFILAPDQFGSLLFGQVTLPYLPLFMTAVMLLLGYLDIYSAAIKDMDQIGEAFLPGDCFWDPLSVLEGAPARMKRNMQERELFNGRMAMLAFAMFVWEETATRKPLISIPANELLFKPLYQVSFIQEYLDAQFSRPSASLDYLPDA